MALLRRWPGLLPELSVTAAPRVLCIVPYCRRTAKRLDAHHEWICGKHWSLVPRAYRRAYARAKRRFKVRQTLLLWKCSGMLWSRCKRAAIERAVGIS